MCFQNSKIRPSVSTQIRTWNCLYLRVNDKCHTNLSQPHPIKYCIQNAATITLREGHSSAIFSYFLEAGDIYVPLNFVCLTSSASNVMEGTLIYLTIWLLWCAKETCGNSKEAMMTMDTVLDKFDPVEVANYDLKILMAKSDRPNLRFCCCSNPTSTVHTGK